MKKLYSQFNRIAIDESIESMQVSEQEIERIKQRVLKQKKCQLPRGLSVAVISIVMVILAGTITGITNPAFAANLPIIGNIFELFKDNEEEYIFDNYQDYASQVGITQESNGVSMTITDVVYDKENITIGYTLETKHDLGEDPFMEGDWELKTITKDNHLLNYHGSTGASQLIEQIDEHTYAGIYMIQLKAGDHPDKIKLNWNKHKIGSFDRDNPPYSMVNPVEGSWNFELTLKAIEREVQKFDDLVSSSEGLEVRLKSISKSPITTSFHFTEIVEANYRNEDWASVFINYKVTDDLGNEYTVVWNGAQGTNPYVMTSRSVTTAINKEASSLIITPIAEIYKMKDSDASNGEMEIVKGPFHLDPIVVPLEKE